ncbi:MAG: hypothetical protein ACOC2Y_09400 [Spirochaetota bacterium]
MDEAIRIIITGGTFYKHYDELRGEQRPEEPRLRSLRANQTLIRSQAAKDSC